MPTPNWGKLLNQDPPSCNDIGIPWTEAEAKAVLEDHIPADYVRVGVLTQAAYEKKKNENEEYFSEHGEYPMLFWTRSELYSEAGRLGIPYTATTPKTVLANAIELGRIKEIEKKKEEEAKLKTDEERENFSELSKTELQELCDGQGIEYKQADKKDDLIKKLKKNV